MHFAVTLRWSWCGANQEKINMATTPNYTQFVSTAKEQVEKSTSQFLKSFESLNALTKQNVDAFVKSSSILAKGFEDISKSTVAYTQSTLESSAAVGKQALAVKTIRDLVDLQSSFAKKSFDSAIAERHQGVRDLRQGRQRGFPADQRSDQRDARQADQAAGGLNRNR